MTCAIVIINTVVPQRESLIPQRSRVQIPGDCTWGLSIDALTGSDRVRLAIDADRLAPLLADWDRAAAQFRASRAGYLLYS